VRKAKGGGYGGGAMPVGQSDECGGEGTGLFWWVGIFAMTRCGVGRISMCSPHDEKAYGVLGGLRTVKWR